jgi:hypothetical protein
MMIVCRLRIVEAYPRNRAIFFIDGDVPTAPKIFANTSP